MPDPHPAAAQTMDEREPSNVELNLWSDVAYTIPYDPVPRSVDGPVIDPSLCMNEPIMDPAPGGHSEPYAFIERPTNEPSVRGMPLHLESPPTPPGTHIRVNDGADTEPCGSSKSFKCQCTLRSFPIHKPTPHLFTRYFLYASTELTVH